MKRLLIIVFCLGFFIPNAFADGWPVFDLAAYTNALSQIRHLETQISEMKNLSHISGEQLTGIHNILQSTKDQLDFYQKTFSGINKYHQKFNSAEDLKRRQWSSWNEILQGANAGQSAFNDAKTRYEQLFPVVPVEKVNFGHDKRGLKRAYYEQSQKVSRSALAASEVSFNGINAHLKALHELLNTAQEADTEKKAIDLNTRLVAEIGFIQIEMMRQQAVQNQLMAMKSQSNVNDASDEASFLQWNK